MFIVDTDCSEEVLFSSKTPYKFMENLNLQVERPNPHCKAIQLNMVHRHGNRYPSSKDVRIISTMADKINQAIDKISPEINLQLPWKNPFTERQDKLLSKVGENELYQIAKRLRARFPEIFVKEYTPLDYKFQSSCKLRCTHSANSLAAGLFESTGSLGTGGFQPIAIETYSCDDDKQLRFFDICDKYLTEVANNKLITKELKLFTKGMEMKSVLEKVKHKLGLPDINLNAVDLKAILVSCAYEIGMFNGSFGNGICSLLDKTDRRILEYALDLKHFYKRSAGYKITYNSSCPLLKDIIVTLESAANDSTDAYLGVFRSSHAETIIPLFALMDIFLDREKLRADNYEKMKMRLFRPALMSPFSGNLYFVLFKCDEGKFKIQLYVNERLVKIPCCDSDIDCDFDIFMNCYKDIIKQCDFKEMCKLKKDAPEKNEL